jgi:hypothetical protein
MFKANAAKIGDVMAPRFLSSSTFRVLWTEQSKKQKRLRVEGEGRDTELITG